MKKPLLTSMFLLIGIGVLLAQQIKESAMPLIISDAYKIEKVKGADCKIITYTINISNKTITVRDDKSVGSFAFASGCDCDKIFNETFQSLKDLSEESFMSSAVSEIELQRDEKIYFITQPSLIGDGYTTQYSTYFFNDKGTVANKKDDVLIGTDYVFDSADADLAPASVSVQGANALSEDEIKMQSRLSGQSYFKLREMVVNRNRIVDELRKRNRLSDITPAEKIQTIRLKKADHFQG